MTQQTRMTQPTTSTSQTEVQNAAQQLQQQHFYSVQCNGTTLYSTSIQEIGQMLKHMNNNDIIIVATYRTSTGRAIW